VGMVGVVHATRAIDVMHRFIGRVELGMIPHIVDTIIFVKGGKIESVLSLSLKVKVPHGMVEQDLARPIIEVLDFETGRPTHEIYTYGDETVVMPVENDKDTSAVNLLAEDKIRSVLKKYTKSPDISIISGNRAIIRVPKEDMSAIIGRKGTNISGIEEKLGIHISIEPIVETLKDTAKYKISESGGYINISLKKEYIGAMADIYKGDEFLFSATIGKKALIKVKKKTDIGNKIMQSILLKNLRVLVE
ncbi:MAG: ATPase, partial [Candidatus Aenigmarchaeota archaeon]|nr:ATPase [Candidatus Aenigmarchaeota archaeon]